MLTSGRRWHPKAHSVNKHAPARRASEKYEKAGTSATLGRMSRFEHTIPSIEVGMDGDEFKPSSIQECGDRPGLRRPDFQQEAAAGGEMARPRPR